MHEKNNNGKEGKEKKKEKKKSTNLDPPIPLPLPIPPLNPLPHNPHNLPPSPPIHPNHKPQPGEHPLILLVQLAQQPPLLLGTGLQLRLLRRTLRGFDFGGAEARVRGEDAEEEGWVGAAQGEKVGFYGGYEGGVGWVGGCEEGG